MNIRFSLSIVALLAVMQIPAVGQPVDQGAPHDQAPAADAATPSSTQANPKTTATTAQPAQPATKVPFGKRILGCVAGTAVGIPVCMVRRSKFEDWYAVKGMIGDSNNKVARGTLRALWMPFAIVTGVCEAPADGTINAIRNSSHPFSKDQFSLGVLKQNQE